MTEPSTRSPDSHSERMRALAGNLRAHLALSRSNVMSKLFDNLLEKSLAEQTTTETALALDVLGKGAAFDASQDATVRVYVHKLRRKLEDYYLGEGASEPLRFAVPKGEYRLIFTEVSSPAHVPAPALPRKTSWWPVALLTVSLLANAAFIAMMVGNTGGDSKQLQSLRNSTLWAPFLDDDLPIYIVVGDYFIFGDTGASMDVQRLVREFDVNSNTDLQQYRRLHPETSERYLNLDLTYLPASAAFALRDLMPILASKNQKIEIVLTSEINAQMLKSAHIIYIGFLSGMGMLQDLAFEKSRFAIGATFDEILDNRTQHNYVSQAAAPVNGALVYYDYGYISSFLGPNGNQFLIVAGTRDVALMESAEILTAPLRIDELMGQAHGAAQVEALYEVSGIDRTNVNSRLLVTSGK